jgi:hypothetical protein
MSWIGGNDENPLTTPGCGERVDGGTGGLADAAFAAEELQAEILIAISVQA